MRTIVAHPLLFHSATCAAEPTTPIIARRQFGPALTGPVVVGVNETISIWCRARNRVMFNMRTRPLRDLFWQRLPIVEKGKPSDFDVYVEVYAGKKGARADTWLRALHFRGTQPSARNYTCVAKYHKNLPQSVEIRVTGGRMVCMVATQAVMA